MKNNKGITKSLVKDLIHESIMKSPVPMCLSSLDDGTYVEVNESFLKYIGMKRQDVIGSKSTDLGIVTVEERKWILDSIKERGFIGNFLLEIKNRDVVQILFAGYTIKISKREFLFSFGKDVFIKETSSKNFQDDKFYKIYYLDDTYVKEKLKKYNLTSRQREIAILLANGNSNLKIAEILYLSPHTVKDHVKEIFRILGLQNRCELLPKLFNLR